MSCYLYHFNILTDAFFKHFKTSASVFIRDFSMQFLLILCLVLELCYEQGHSSVLEGFRLGFISLINVFQNLPVEIPDSEVFFVNSDFNYKFN